jgi:ribosomal protein S6--L-glutamate ligase
MRVGIVGWDRTEYESLHLLRAGGSRGHETTLFTLDDVCWGGDGPLVSGRPAGEFDVILSRAQLRRERWQPDLERLTLLSDLPGTPILDPAAEFVAAESKFVQVQRFRAAGLPVLPTVCCSSVAEVRSAVETWGTTVVKPSFGLEGNDVELVPAGAPLPPVVERLLRRYENLVAQPYLPHPRGAARLTVVGGEMVLAFLRVPAPGGWKANVAQGARVEPFTPSPELVELALRATAAMSITTAGVDFLLGPDGPVVGEINNGPGWHPLPEEWEATVVNALLDFAERVATDHDRLAARGPAVTRGVRP